MQFSKEIWWAALLPAATCSLLGSAILRFQLDDPSVAIVALGMPLLTGITVAMTFGRAARNLCGERLRHQLWNPESIRGPFRGFLQDAAELVRSFESEARTAAQRREEIEARFHVRQKHVQRLETALHALESPVLITDTRGEPLFANRAADILFPERENPQAQGKSPQDACRGITVEQVAALIEETRTRNAASDRRVTEISLNLQGETALFSAAAQNLYDSEDNLLGVAVVLHDIRDVTAIRTRHAEFVSSVSHEMKTPMAGIKAYVEMLIDGDVEDAEETQELYGFIDVQIDRLTRLIDNMLNLARIESGVIRVQRQDCELNDVLQKALDVVRPVCEDKKLKLVSELSDLYLPVHVDADLMGQAVINLLSNAAKYTPNEGEIRLRSRMDDDRAIIEVRDTGMGIPQNSLDHVFDRFYRVPENKSVAAGTGLGLSLVRYIVSDIHNGAVHVDSVVGKGSCFTIEIPLGHRDQGRKRQCAVACLT